MPRSPISTFATSCSTTSACCPFHPAELEARIRHLLWRTGAAPTPDVVEYRELQLNVATYQATIGGHHLDLTYMEYELLKFLAQNPGKVFTREVLLNRVWGYEYYGGRPHGRRPRPPAARQARRGARLHDRDGAFGRLSLRPDPLVELNPPHQRGGDQTDAMGYVDVGPMRMFYDEQGPADAPPLVLLHGGMGVATDPLYGWAGLAPSFAEQFHLVLVDHRGHGRTANPAGWMTFEQLGDDLNALIEHLGLGPVHLAGISDGGVMALDQALRRPATVRTLVLIGTNYCVDEQHPQARSTRSTPTPSSATTRTSPARFAGRPRRRQAPRILEGADRARSSTTTGSTRHGRSIDLRQVRCPTLLIAGEDDPFANTRADGRDEAEIPDAEWLIVNHSGHAVHSERPEIVGPRIVDFLLRHS